MEKKNHISDALLSPTDALLFADRGRLLEDENSGGKDGYTVMPDGTGYVSNTVQMADVTAEMLDWYIAWRGLEPQNYAAVNPENHISSVSMQKGRFEDEDLIGAEKYWDTTQTVIRRGNMGNCTEYVNFKCPSDVGFDMDALKRGKTAGLICARVYAEGQPPQAGPDYFVCHQIMETNAGIKVRSRYWIGWTVRYGKDYKQLPDGFHMPPVFAMEVMQKNMQELTDLARVLPGLYAENRA